MLIIWEQFEGGQWEQTRKCSWWKIHKQELFSLEEGW